MEINFTGKRAVVTGASQVSLKQEVPSIEIYPVDLSKWSDTENALKQVGDVDLLINNAGLAVLGPLTEVSENDVDRIFSINVKAVINITKYVVKNLLSRNVPGSIVNISSQASVTGLIDHTVYCASKGAVDAFTRATAAEYGPHGIRINNVNPTVIMTDMGRLGWSDPQVANPMLAKIPLRRFGEVDEVVNSVIFLLSDLSSMTTGSNVYVDGGFVSV
ncbi:L-xylulose reductase-like isoform X2 [Rhynchophorus ferrugineus]|uniref:L-xylulose reductase-like isoform X2 n=1 Tax=Rhynchophorus ferrugineus TaxID=354439 RepID=UPI003FCE750A